MQCIVIKYLHIKHTEKNALCYFKHSQILKFGKKLITAHCCFDVSKLMTRTRTCGVLQEVLKLLKPYLVYDPKPKVMYMGHIRPTGKPFTWLPRFINRQSNKHRPIAAHSLLFPMLSGGVWMGRAARVRARGRDRAVLSTLQYCTCLNLALASFSFIRPCATR